MRQLKPIAVGLFLITILWAVNLHSAELRIGTATADITPALPAALGAVQSADRPHGCDTSNG